MRHTMNQLQIVRIIQDFKRPKSRATHLHAIQHHVDGITQRHPAHHVAQHNIPHDQIGSPRPKVKSHRSRIPGRTEDAPSGRTVRTARNHNRIRRRPRKRGRQRNRIGGRINARIHINPVPRPQLAQFRQQRMQIAHGCTRARARICVIPRCRAIDITNCVGIVHIKCKRSVAIDEICWRLTHRRRGHAIQFHA